MRKYFYLFILIICNNAFSQSNLFDTLTIDQSTKIIGRYPQYDKTKKFEKYNFILENSTDISDFIKIIQLGEEIDNSSESPNFFIDVIKNYKDIGGWSINPTLKSASTQDGHTYKFNLNQISDLNKKHPFEYYYEKVDFESLEEFQTYLQKQKNNPNFLFDYAPQFKYEGSFEMEFEKSEKFSSPKAISQFLYPFLNKIVDKSKYRVTYIFNDRNKKNHGKSYKMTITGPKKIYEDLKIKEIKNEKWQPTIENGWFFYRK